MKFKFLAFFIFCWLPLISSAVEDRHLISVNGVAESTVDPNMLTMTVQSWAKASTAQAAQATQAAQYKKIMGVIEKFKIGKDDFKSENFSVLPEMSYDPKTRRNKTLGFIASHTLSIIFKKVEEAGTFVDALAATSKNDASSGVSVQNIEWDTDKRAVYESAVINEAVRGARARAEELAKAAGVKIKAVHRISHTSYTPQATFSGAMMKASMIESADAVPQTQFSAGKIKIRVDVQMEFEI